MKTTNRHSKENLEHFMAGVKSERQRIEQAVDFWLHVHEKDGLEFSSEDFINYLFEKIDES